MILAISTMSHFVDRGLIKLPFFIQMIYGILGGAGADLDNLNHAHNVANRLFGDDYEWSVLAAGRHQMNFCTAAAMLGGNVRVGLEDLLYIGKGELAASNADQVAKIRRIVEDLSLTVATPMKPAKDWRLRAATRLLTRAGTRPAPDQGRNRWIQNCLLTVKSLMVMVKPSPSSSRPPVPRSPASRRRQQNRSMRRCGATTKPLPPLPPDPGGSCRFAL